MKTAKKKTCICGCKRKGFANSYFSTMGMFWCGKDVYGKKEESKPIEFKNWR